MVRQGGGGSLAAADASLVPTSSRCLLSRSVCARSDCCTISPARVRTLLPNGAKLARVPALAERRIHPDASAWRLERRRWQWRRCRPWGNLSGGAALCGALCSQPTTQRLGATQGPSDARRRSLGLLGPAKKASVEAVRPARDLQSAGDQKETSDARKSQVVDRRWRRSGCSKHGAPKRMHLHTVTFPSSMGALLFSLSTQLCRL